MSETANVTITINGVKTSANISTVKLPLSNGNGYAHFELASVDGSTANPELGILYQLPEVTTFDGTNYIDTGVKLMETDMSYSIAFEGTPENDGVIANNKDYSNTSAFYGFTLNGKKLEAYNNITGIVFSILQKMKVVVTHEAGSSTMGLYVKNADGTSKEVRSVSGNYVYGQSSSELRIGAKSNSNASNSNKLKGTIDQFIVYDRVLSEEELDAFFA